MHLPRHNFTRPGTKLNKRLNPDLTPKKWSKPINRVDKAAYHHDVCYLKNNDTATRNAVCDKSMLKELKGIYNPTIREKMDSGLVFSLIGTKARFGWGFDRKKKASTLAEELHKPIRRKFKRRRVLVSGIDKIWAADLVDMQAFSKFNGGVKYLLAVIDVLSKYGWLISLKDKTGKSVASALKTIFEERKPEKMWVEFHNKDVKDLIELYSTENEEKSSVVERWIRTMIEKMWKYFTANSTNVYLNQLSNLVKEYNNTRHSSMKMTPVKASKKENELAVWRNLYPRTSRNKRYKP